MCVCVRLLAQLRDMEMAFDGFFEKHHLKLQQYLQLLRYEISFHEVLYTHTHTHTHYQSSLKTKSIFRF